MDPDSNSIILQLVILLILIGVNAFFAMSEIAIVTFNDNKLKKLAEDGNKRAATLYNAGAGHLAGWLCAALMSEK